jgi:hypothetical protein
MLASLRQIRALLFKAPPASTNSTRVFAATLIKSAGDALHCTHVRKAPAKLKLLRAIPREINLFAEAKERKMSSISIQEVGPALAHLIHF